LIDQLNPGDLLSVVTFGSEVEVLATAVPGHNQELLHELIDTIRVSGQTNLHGGWLAAAHEVAAHYRQGFLNRVILVSDGMANLASTDDQLAFVLAHELAHAVLEHRTQPDVTGLRGASNRLISLRRGLSAGAEADADHMGLFLAARAGFDPRAAMDFLDLFEAADRGARQTRGNPGGLYGPVSIRRRALEPVLADIAARRAAGRVLIP
jgi:hypothetical protein